MEEIEIFCKNCNPDKGFDRQMPLDDNWFEPQLNKKLLSDDEKALLYGIRCSLGKDTYHEILYAIKKSVRR